MTGNRQDFPYRPRIPRERRLFPGSTAKVRGVSWMLISTTRTLGMRCLSCGERILQSLSLFALNREGCRLTCLCGQQLAEIGPPVKNQYCLSYECPYCSRSHQRVFSATELTGSEPIPLVCPELEIAVAFIGPEAAVREAFSVQDQSLEEMARELGFMDYFENPEIMYEILGRLYQIAESGNLSCGCGNYYIEVEVFSDRVELRCNRCGAIAMVCASTADDWRIVQRTWEIRLAKGRNERFDPRRRSLRE